MRNEHPDDRKGDPTPEDGQVEVPHDERTFFESYYRATIRGHAEDRQTIGSVSDLEARFHYNAVETALLRAVAHRTAVPRGPMVETWRLLQRRAGLRHLDVGAGTGHFVDFFRDVLYASGSVAVEIVPQMAAVMREKYAGCETVTVLEADIADPDFGPDLIGGPVDYVSAIGVMFHLVDDARWAAALGHLASVLKPGGLLFVGGDFGAETHNVQFHREDRFDTWRRYHTAAGVPGEIRVNKRVRSLATWVRAAGAIGLDVVDLVRAERDHAIATPENDVLVLARPETQP